ncbi:MAG: hypothetical protein Q4D51_09375 [Eubacteriales bacterium]|nr:hypothetical protein [Eubacteriales bacterium]
MENYKGVTQSQKKDGSIYYRSSITIQSKHVSLGSFSDAKTAAQAYNEACAILRENKYTLEDYSSHFALDFSKFVILMNYRNTGIYFKTPIYLQTRFFYYFFSPKKYLIFDREDLFFYANHKIQTRGGYFFICNYGSQYSILSRYGIKSYAKKGIDYIFMNQNDYDFRYENLRVINEYMGVTEITTDTKTEYECKIHIKGNTLVGRYPDKISAAIAYNKAIDTLHNRGVRKQYIKNYISSLSAEQYMERYQDILISSKLEKYEPDRK